LHQREVVASKERAHPVMLRSLPSDVERISLRFARLSNDFSAATEGLFGAAIPLIRLNEAPREGYADFRRYVQLNASTAT